MSIHLFSSQEENNHDNCEVCEFAIYNQNLDFSSAQEFQSLEVHITHSFPHIEDYYKSVFHYIQSNNKTLFGRPPPSLI